MLSVDDRTAIFIHTSYRAVYSRFDEEGDAVPLYIRKATDPVECRSKPSARDFDHQISDVHDRTSWHVGRGNPPAIRIENFETTS